MPSVEEKTAVSREKIKKEILGEIRHEERRRKRRSCLFWLAVKLVILLVPLVLVAVMIAKSGLYSVPLLSGWLYEPATPTRTVTPLVGFDSEAIVKQAMARAEYEPGPNRFKIYLTEQELTSLLQESMARTDGQSPLPIKEIQAVVNTEGIEMFLVTPREERDVTVKALLKPRAEAGELRMDIDSLRIGALNVPGFAVDMISRAMAGQLAKSLSMSDSGLGDLQDARVSEKRIELDFQPTLKLPF